MLTFAGLPERSAEYERARRRLPMRSALAVGVSVAVALVVVLVTAGVAAWSWLGPVVGAAVGAAVWFRPRHPLARVVSLYELVEADPDRYPRLDNLVESLSYTAGVDEPTVYVHASTSMNLAALAEGDDAALVVTEGLLTHLDRVELEGVLAAGLARIRSGDARLATEAADRVCGPLIAQGPGQEGGRGRGAARSAAARAARLAALFPEHRAIENDLAAAALTRYPPALYKAMVKIAEHGSEVPGSSWGTAHLWFADPLPAADDPVDAELNERFDLHGPIARRIDVLGEL